MASTTDDAKKSSFIPHAQAHQEAKDYPEWLFMMMKDPPSGITKKRNGVDPHPSKGIWYR